MTIIRIIFLLLCSATPFSVLWAQTGRVMEARVVDADTGRPLMAASVCVEGKKGTLLTNADGVFRLTAASERQTVRISYIGYQTRNFLSEDMPKTIGMKPVTVELGEVMVSSDNKLVSRIVKETQKRLKREGHRVANYLYDQTTQVDNEGTSHIQAVFRARCAYALADLWVMAGSYAVNEQDDRGYFTHLANLYPLSQITLARGNSDVGYGQMVAPLTTNYRRYYAVTKRVLIDNDQKIYALRFQPRKVGRREMFDGTLYVDSATLLLHKAEGKVAGLHVIANYGRADIEKVPAEERFVVLFNCDDGYSEVSSVMVEATYTTDGHDYHFHSLFTNIGHDKWPSKGQPVRPLYDLRRQIDELPPNPIPSGEQQSPDYNRK